MYVIYISLRLFVNIKWIHIEGHKIPSFAIKLVKNYARTQLALDLRYCCQWRTIGTFLYEFLCNAVSAIKLPINKYREYTLSNIGTYSFVKAPAVFKNVSRKSKSARSFWTGKRTTEQINNNFYIKLFKIASLDMLYILYAMLWFVFNFQPYLKVFL